MVHKGSFWVWIVFRWLGLYKLLGPQQQATKQHTALVFLAGFSAGLLLSVWWSTLMCYMAVKTRGCLFSNIYQFFTMITNPLSCTSHKQTDFPRVCMGGMKVQGNVNRHIPQSLEIGKGLHLVKMWMWGKIVILQQSVSHAQACRNGASRAQTMCKISPLDMEKGVTSYSRWPLWLRHGDRPEYTRIRIESSTDSPALWTKHPVWDVILNLGLQIELQTEL